MDLSALLERNAQAIEYYKKAAARGHTKAVAKIAQAYSTPWLFGDNDRKENARYWGGKAANNGDPEGFYALAKVSVDQAYEGMEKSDLSLNRAALTVMKRGLEYMRTAASMGYGPALVQVPEIQAKIASFERSIARSESYASQEDPSINPADVIEDVQALIGILDALK